MGKTIGLINQKGGVGKSMLTTFIAMSIQKSFNPDDNPQRVCVYDTDNPQYSTFMQRLYELDEMEYYENKKNDSYYSQKLSAAYQAGYELYDVFKGSLEEYKLNVEKLKKKYDYVIVDVVGTMNTIGFNNEFLESFDFIIVPTDLKYEPMRSTLKFFQNVLQPLIDKGTLKDYSILLNKIEHFEKPSLVEAKNSLKTIEARYFKNYLKKKEKYTKLFIQDKRGFMSSVIPIMDIDIYKVTEELIKKMN